MRMKMGVLRLSMEVRVLVDEVYSEQEILISQNLIGTSCLLNSVIFRQDDSVNPEFSHQAKIVSGQNNRFSRLIQG